jgi:hypothetical protein
MILNKDQDISPLLKLYDQLAQNTMFKLPSKEILKLDQTVFTKVLEKFRMAHKVELKWLKHSLEKETKDYI